VIKTQFDLCADTADLDYQKMIQTAQIAVGYSRDSLHYRVQQWYNLGKPCTHVDAEWMLRDAEALAIATTTRHFLIEASKRGDIRLVNLPERPTANPVED